MFSRFFKSSALAIMISTTMIVTMAPQPAHAVGLFDMIFGNKPKKPKPHNNGGGDIIFVDPGNNNNPWDSAGGDDFFGEEPQAPIDGEVPPESDKDVALNEFRNQPVYNLPMYLTRLTWTEQDEAGFGQFVNQLGRAISSKQCNTVKNCMRNPDANMFAQYDPPGLVLYSDCADFPYFLRAYYAYHQGLPMGFVNDVEMNQAPYASVANRDADLPTARLDNSPYGNAVVSRGGSMLSKKPGLEPNFIKYLERMFDNVSTRTLRVSPFAPNYDLHDFYPVKIDKNGIGPGTMVHSTGHALVVWNVTPKGSVQVIDAHPDGSVQFKEIKSSTLDRSRPDHGLGFFRFRPLTVKGAQQAGNGAYYGGKIVPEKSIDLFNEGKFSFEQWYGPGSELAPGTPVTPEQWESGFKSPGFFDFLAARMRDENLVISAVDEVSDSLNSLCNEFQQRVADVDAALAPGVALNMQPHPMAIPMDIFSAPEDRPWEDFSTPGRDSRMRASVEDIIKTAVAKFRLAKSGDKNITFKGSAEDYVKALRAKVKSMDETCKVVYTNSKGGKVELAFNKLISRLGRLSFDPYHCAERRWGGSDMTNCRDQDVDGAWYAAEQPLRNVVGKVKANEVATIRSIAPITIDMLLNPALIDQPDTAQTSLGTAQAPVVDLDKNFAAPKFLELLTK